MRMETAGGAPIIHLDADPPPPGLVARWAVMDDGARLRAAIAPPSAGAAKTRGSVLIAPGRTETVEKYFETMGELAARGFASFALDHRGQGLSDRALEGGRGHIDRFSRYGADFAAAAEMVADSLPRPWVLLGHSMGGLVALELLLDRRLDVAGAVLSAPMTGLARVTRMQLWGASAASRLGWAGAFIPGGGLRPAPAFEDNRITRDGARYQHMLDRLAAAPELSLGDPTLGWTAAAHAAMRRAMRARALRGLETPLLIVSAEHDGIVDNAGHARIAALAPGAAQIVIPGARHEILTETDAARAAFWAAFDAFVGGLGL